MRRVTYNRFAGLHTTDDGVEIYRTERISFLVPKEFDFARRYLRLRNKHSYIHEFRSTPKDSWGWFLTVGTNEISIAYHDGSVKNKLTISSNSKAQKNVALRCIALFMQGSDTERKDNVQAYITQLKRRHK